MANDARRLAAGIAVTTTGALLWGYSGACIQWLSDGFEVTPPFITMARSIIAAALFALMLLARHRTTLKAMFTDGKALASLAVFGLAMFGSQFFYAWSVSVTNAGTATVLQMTNCVFIIAFVAFRSRKAPTLLELAALALAFVGTFVIATQGDPTTLALPAEGILIGLANGLCVAIYIVFPKPQVQHFGSFASTGAAMMIDALVATLFWGAGACFGGFEIPAPDYAGAAVLVIGVGVLGTFAAFGLYLKGVSMVGEVRGSLLGAFEPVGAIVIGCLWLGNAFTGADAVGTTAMMIMLALVTIRPRSGCSGRSA